MTPKQKANRERFKKVMAEAKKLRIKNKKLSQAEAVKQAWAISYNKKPTSVGVVKKTAAKKVSKAKIKSALMLAKKVGAAATKVKAKKPKSTSEMHTDTKSHNVNIRVVSGVKQVFAIPSGLTKKQTQNEIELLTNSLKWNKAFLKASLSAIDKKVLRAKIKHINGTIKSLKTYLRSLK